MYGNGGLFRIWKSLVVLSEFVAFNRLCPGAISEGVCAGALRESSLAGNVPPSLKGWAGFTERLHRWLSGSSSLRGMWRYAGIPLAFTFEAAAGPLAVRRSLRGDLSLRSFRGDFTICVSRGTDYDEQEVKPQRWAGKVRPAVASRGLPPPF
jgi:hypothetical protein